jgi:hypothetical protein
MYLLPALLALVEKGRPRNPAMGVRHAFLDSPWLVLVLLFTTMIGFRFQVGGDWYNYLRMLNLAQGFGFENIPNSPVDPGYTLVSVFSLTMGWGIAGVNVICGGLFMIGLATFCRSLARPWLALAVALPYLVVVVAMGYTRQSVALGFEMLGLTALSRQSTVWFVIWTLFGATFHKSAVLLLPIAALASASNRFWTSIWIAAATGLAYLVLLQKESEELYTNYIGSAYSSSGALVRTLMNVVPAFLFLYARRRISFAKGEERLWYWFSIISIMLFGVLFVSPSSTAVDRVALYMLPLQLFVFSNVPAALSRESKTEALVAQLITLYYAAVLLVWLTYADNSVGWLPYRSFLTE